MLIWVTLSHAGSPIYEQYQLQLIWNLLAFSEKVNNDLGELFAKVKPTYIEILTAYFWTKYHAVYFGDLKLLTFQHLLCTHLHNHETDCRKVQPGGMSGKVGF